ncbi:MAG: nuclear transport factor 2 family protein [Mesorhizobium sp.]
MRNEGLEERLARIEALEEIRRLKARYCLHCDRGYDGEALAALFTADAVWDAGPHRGVFRGRQAIRDFFDAISSAIPYAAHLVTNPLIEVEGDAARGNWRMLMPCMLREGGTEIAAFQVAEYDETYTRIDGTWLIAGLKVRLRRLTVPAGKWKDPSFEDDSNRQ